ncbi:glycosyltransferase family 2 protein [Rhizobium sp.]
MKSLSSVSAIVCTSNRYPDLYACLESLERASSNASIGHEIIVIDQTPDDLRDRKLAARFPNINHIFQNDTGLSSARNFGFGHANGSIIAYLDDDAIVSGNWFDEIAAPFSAGHQSVLAVGGKVTADYRKGSKPSWMTPPLEAYLSCIDWGNKPRPLKPGEWIVGANMAFRRDVFERIDLFDVALGRKGTRTLMSNEEVSLIEKIGLENIWYTPQAEVAHVIGLERMQQKWFRKRVYWQAVSDMIADVGWLQPDEGWRRISTFLAASPAELRSIRAFFQECPDSELFEKQLNAIYAMTVLGSEGFSHLDI